jgi:RNA polymerase sigma-70 factor (ECF subfamily)
MVAMLAEDARVVMPPLPSWYAGRDQAAAFLRAYGHGPAQRWQVISTSANGQPAVAAYLWDETRAVFVAHVLNVLTFRGRQIEEITAFLTPELFPRFDLPSSIAA